MCTLVSNTYATPWLKEILDLKNNRKRHTTKMKENYIYANRTMYTYLGSIMMLSDFNRQ